MHRRLITRRTGRFHDYREKSYPQERGGYERRPLPLPPTAYPRPPRRPLLPPLRSGPLSSVPTAVMLRSNRHHPGCRRADNHRRYRRHTSSRWRPTHTSTNDHRRHRCRPSSKWHHTTMSNRRRRRRRYNSINSPAHATVP